jgi:DNA-binding NarL/FixJ family response regulator
MLTLNGEHRAPQKIRVLIADDHVLFAEAVNLLLATDPRVEFVGHAPDGVTAVELALDAAPDVVLMDIHMPNGDGFEATKRLLKELPQVAVVMLTSSSSPDDVARARAVGASAYVTKDADAIELRETIHQAYERSRQSANARTRRPFLRRALARRPFLAFARPA